LAAKINSRLQQASVSITGLMLAGGEGRRAGYRDKGMIEWQGQALAAHVYQRLAPQVDDLIISCNRNLGFYARFGTTISDLRAGFQGPLAGLEAARGKIQSQFILLVPCDTPLLPLDLAARLMAGLERDSSAGISYARSGEEHHYLCALLRQHCLDGITAYLDGGGRTVRHWYEQCGCISEEFAAPGAFLNINHPD